MNQQSLKPNFATNPLNHCRNDWNQVDSLYLCPKEESQASLIWNFLSAQLGSRLAPRDRGGVVNNSKAEKHIPRELSEGGVRNL